MSDRSKKERQLKKSVQDACLFERVERTVLGDGAQRLAGNLHADVATAATVELRHPDALLLKVGVDGAVHRLGDVATDTALLLSKTGAVDAATLVGHSERDVADSGHKILKDVRGHALYFILGARQAKL